jgi:hypothetical protein
MLAMIIDFQMRAAGQTVAIGWRRTEDAETDAADKAYINHVAMTEACGAKVDGDTGREDEMETGGLWGGEEGG